MKGIFSSLLVALITTTSTFIVMFLIGKLKLVSLLNIFFFEGSLFIVFSAVLSIGNLAYSIDVSKIYLDVLDFLIRTNTKESREQINGAFLTFTTGIFIYGIMFLAHIILKPKF